MQIVLVGATGDLACRMLLPSLYHLDREGLLGADVRVIGVSRQDLGEIGFVDQVRSALAIRLDGAAPDVANADDSHWARFSKRLSYVCADLTRADGARRLAAAVGDDETIFYLAVSPSLYGAICGALCDAGLTRAPNRVVLEKPIGRSAASSGEINEAVGRAFSEDRVFRIDHYLGKETVQNLLALRFANTLFEPLWNSVSIDHVQITVAETEGVGDRWPYYDDYGAMRDMLQNHMLQLLCLVAMEPPASLDPGSVRNEKVKTLRSLRPITRADVQSLSVRGQYRAGVVGGVQTSGYLEERGAPSDTETYVALCAHVDNWRWAGVPFFLRTGKRLPERRTQIVIQFKPVPHSIFAAASQDLVANRLVIDLQPDEDISLLLMNKAPGLDEGGMRLSPLPLSLSLAKAFGAGRRRIAYERLLLDVIKNNTTLFVRRDEVEASWAWVDGVVKAWAEAGQPARPYDGGGWGPPGAFALIERGGRAWHEADAA